MIPDTKIVPIVMVSLLLIVSCTNNPLTIDTEKPADSETENSVTEAVLSYDDYAHETNLAKTTGIVNPVNKWHYRNVILPKQGGILYWYLAQKCADYDVRPKLRYAFARWALSTPFKIEETTVASKANIVVKFVNTPTVQLKTGNVSWWKNGKMTLAYAYPPVETSPGLGLDYVGDVIFNDYNVNWKGCRIGVKEPGSYYFKSTPTQDVHVLVHEVGHAMGLGHSSSTTDVMYPVYNTYSSEFGKGDMQTVTQLYDPSYHLIYGQKHVDQVIRSEFARILGKAPTSAQLSSYRTKLMWNFTWKVGEFYSYRKFIIDLAGSTDSWNRSGATRAKYIPAMFKLLVARSPTAAELSTYDTSMKNGWTAAQVAAAIVNTVEWHKGIVKQYYSKQFGKAPTQTWINDKAVRLYINMHVLEPWCILREIVRSDAYYNLSTPRTPGGYINRMYKTILGATPSSTESVNWISWYD